MLGDFGPGRASIICLSDHPQQLTMTGFSHLLGLLHISYPSRSTSTA